MKLLSDWMHEIRVWIGLNDPSDARLTPPHGWLLPAPADVRIERKERDALRASGPPR